MGAGAAAACPGSTASLSSVLPKWWRLVTIWFTAGFYAAVRKFVVIIFIAAPLFSFTSWVEERLVLSWRAHLTRLLTRKYFAHRPVAADRGPQRLRQVLPAAGHRRAGQGQGEEGDEERAPLLLSHVTTTAAAAAAGGGGGGGGGHMAASISLDEATSALDGPTESRLYSLIRGSATPSRSPWPPAVALKWWPQA
eukprot:XP_001700365.1 predicted protein [Chlamydomonas reinhardtii]